MAKKCEAGQAGPLPELNEIIPTWLEFSENVRRMAEELRLSHECHERIFITLGKLMESAAATLQAADLSTKTFKEYSARLEAELKARAAAPRGKGPGAEGGY